MRGPDRPLGRDGGWSHQGSRRPTDPPPAPRFGPGDVIRPIEVAPAVRFERVGRTEDVEGEPRRRISISPNMAGALVMIGVLAVGGVFFQFRAASTAKTPPPTPKPIAAASESPAPSASSSGSARPSATTDPLSIPQPVQDTIEVELPFAITAPEPDLPYVFASGLYIAGPSSIVRVNEAPGGDSSELSATFKSSIKDVHRLVAVNGGLWATAWSGEAAKCDPSCWKKATTYRIDPESGKTLRALPGQYVLGAGENGVWVGGRGRIEELNAITGALVTGFAYDATSGDVRVGCGFVWTIEQRNTISLLTPLSDQGKAGEVQQSDSIGFRGPFSVGGTCWTTEDVGDGRTALVEFNAPGQIISAAGFPVRLTIMGDEFWSWTSEAVIRRWSPGGAYGQAFQLPAEAVAGGRLNVIAGDKWLWLISGNRLRQLPITSGPKG